MFDPKSLLDGQSVEQQTSRRRCRATHLLPTHPHRLGACVDGTPGDVLTRSAQLGSRCRDGDLPVGTIILYVLQKIITSKAPTTPELSQKAKVNVVLKEQLGKLENTLKTKPISIGSHQMEA